MKTFRKILVIVLTMACILAPAAAFAENLLGAEDHNIMIGGSNVPEWVANAGRSYVIGEATFYIADDGTVSAMIKGNGVTWIRVENGPDFAWYGIDNSNGQFQPGSRFWAKLISKATDAEEYDKIMELADRETKRSIESNTAFFMFGVTDPEGMEYRTFDVPVNFYIELGDEWDQEDIRANFISNSNDEPVSAMFVTVNSPDGRKEFCKLEMNHFGEPLSVGESNSFIGTVWTSYQPFITIACAVVIALAVMMIVRKKNRG